MRITDLSIVRGFAFCEKRTSTPDELDVRDAGGGLERTIVTNASFGAADGTFLGAFAVSPDAKTLALHVYVGKTVSDVHVVRVADGTDAEPPLHDTVFDYIGFTADGTRLTYARAPGATAAGGVPPVSYDYLHRRGSPQSADAKIFGGDTSPVVDVPTHDFAFVDVSTAQAVAEVRDVAAGGSRFYTAPVTTLGQPNTPWRPLGTAASGYTDYTIHGTTIDLATNADAPNYAVVRASLIGAFEPRVILPASDTVVVSGTLDFIPKAGIFALNAAADADYVQLLDRRVARVVRIPYDRDARPLPVALPFDGSVLAIATTPEAPGALLHMTSWSEPGDVYAFDPGSGATIARGFLPAGNAPPRVAEELTVIADDGTRIPLSVVHRPGIALDGSHATILRVAGAYGFSQTPDYRIVPEAWLARGGVYAVAHVRGGGELGETWHRAGMGERKSTTWTDTIASAKRLIEAGYTSPKLLDLSSTTQSYLGGIASAIAIGRAIEERPDLFAAAVVDEPAFDMLRSERTPLGRQAISEFGSVATQTGFAGLLAMSPYEHVRTGVSYPKILVRSFEHRGIGDDWQAAKMVARLQAAAGRTGAAYFDAPGASSDDRRTQADLRDDALAFFLYANASR